MRGDPLNLIRVMPAKGQGCIKNRRLREESYPFISLAPALPAIAKLPAWAVDAPPDAALNT